MENKAESVSKSLDNFDLVHSRRAAGVWAYQIEAELGIHPTAVSNFERGKRDQMSSGMGRESYLEALERIVARRAGAEREAVAS